MGLLSKMKNVASSVTSSTRNHRKSVLYDFSIVEKASIKILEAKNKYMRSEDEALKQIDELYVQINPTEFSCTYQTPASNPLVGVKSSSSESFNQVVLRESDGTKAMNEIPLVYDIYDEYNIRTFDGFMPSNNFSLMNKEITSLPCLIEHVEAAPRYGYFVWGDVKIFGLLSSIRVDYRAFSRWGQPLKANATLELVIQQLPADKPGPTITTSVSTVASGATNKVTTFADNMSSVGNFFR